MDTRIIPCLQLSGDQLVKTTRFRDPKYIGDPVNTVRIFNELEVDELCFLDIRATVENREPYYPLLQQIAEECFMPLSYGGGITGMAIAKKIFRCGFEKIILNSAAIEDPSLVSALAAEFGSQAVMVSIDVKKDLLGPYMVTSRSATKKTGRKALEWAQEAEALGAGEILLTSVNREGSWEGFDTPLVKKISAAIHIPLIAHGGAGSVEQIASLVKDTGVSAVGVGNLFIYQKKGMGVLINFPAQKIQEAFNED